MMMEILKDSSELAERNYEEIMKGVFVCRDEGSIVILENDDTGLIVSGIRR